MASRRGKSGGSDRFYLGSKFTADGDCSHDVKRCLLLGRKAMTNLDSIIKSRDIILLTKIHIVTAMGFLVIICRCESWTIKKAEYWRNWCFQIVVLEKTFESPLDCKTILKEINSEYSLERLMLKLKFQNFGHLMQRADSLERTLMQENIEGKGEGTGRGWDGEIASPA